MAGMAGFFRSLLKLFGLFKKECKIVVVGLDASGKSTLINFLKPQKLASYEVTPTVGFSQEAFEKGKLKFTVFDMAGGGTYRSLWEAYYKDIDAIIFVVDSTDRIRMAVAKDELDALLGHPDVRKAGAPVLFFANKMDLPGALEPPGISALLSLHRITDRAWQIQASNALTGDGVEPGIEWLATQLTDTKGSVAAAGAAGKGRAAGAAAPAAAGAAPAAPAVGGAGAGSASPAAGGAGSGGPGPVTSSDKA